MKILILEDCSLVNHRFRMEFVEEEVTYFESVEGLMASSFDINSVDLIISDNYMGKIEGLQWLIGVHQIKHKHIPAILFSSCPEKVKLAENLTNVFGCQKDYEELQRLIMLIFSEEVRFDTVPLG